MRPSRRTIFGGLLALLALLGTPLTHATEAGKAFESANRLYEEKKYAEAAAAYESILATGQASPAVYFNLGNAWFKANQTGRAIAAYHRAEQITPRDPDVQANLRFARSQVEGPTLRPNRWQRAFDSLSLTEWTSLAVAGFWITFSLLTAAQLRPAWKPSLRTVTLVAGGGTLLAIACLAAARTTNSAGKVIAVIAPEVSVRRGPLDESQSAFTAHDGAEFRIVDRKDDWLQITDDAGRIGWLKQREVATW